MVAEAKGTFILLLNNDVVLHEDALKTLYEYAIKQGGREILGVPQYDIKTGELIDIGCLLDPFLNPVPNKDVNRLNVAMVTGACLWIPKALWEELGGFLEWFECLAEDTYLCCLARLKGYDVLVIPKSGFDHWVGESLGGGKVFKNSLRTTFLRRRLSERNKCFVMFLCCPSPIIYFLIPVHFIFLMLEGIILSLAKKDGRIFSGIYLNCIKSLWVERQQLMNLRGKIQSERQIMSSNFFNVFSCVPYKLKMLMKCGLPAIER